jgi:hypothetical protein
MPMINVPRHEEPAANAEQAIIMSKRPFLAIPQQESPSTAQHALL